MPLLGALEAEVYASHCQFYVADPDVEPRTDLVWDGPSLERRLGAVDGLVAVGTVGYTFLPVRIELWAREPSLDLEAWDHIVDASVETRSGRLALASVEGPVEGAELAVGPGWYRFRSSAGELHGATETDGGDRYRVQLWRDAPREPEVLKWWPPWDPTAVEPRRTTDGTLLVGAAAEDARVRMTWLAARGQAHLFRDAEGILWEHSNLPDASGTPQLEELTAEEAESRYGARAGWVRAVAGRPSTGTMLQNVLQTLRYRRGRRPQPEPEEIVVDGLRVLLGGAAITRTGAMQWVDSKGGDNLYVDADGAYWEWRNADAATGEPKLRELGRDTAAEKYGLDP